LALVLGLIAYGVGPLVDGLAERWFLHDMDSRAAVLAADLRAPLLESLQTGSHQQTAELLTSFARIERLYAVGVCTEAGAAIIATEQFPNSFACGDLERFAHPALQQLDDPHGALHVSVRNLLQDGVSFGRLILVNDMSFIQRRGAETNRYLFYFLVSLAAIFAVVTVVVAHLSWSGLVAGMRGLLRGRGLSGRAELSTIPELRPLEMDLRELMREVRSDVQARDAAPVTWSPDALRQILRHDLKGDHVIVVSNREPYSHERIGGHIEVHRPASGLVTAMEPVMRACSGTWIAQGSGTADRDVVDKHDRISVPPDHPAYQIRRIWLSVEEEAGFYSGFANEGLWPLCHIAHVRPIFRGEDWRQYVAVNQKFADAVVTEAKSDNPIVLVQDYHFALLPRMIRERLPNATIITFWHIPWPNPEAFAICPWRAEILDGLLGSSILGFHIQFHCNNFVDTVERLLEARVDRENFTVSYGGLSTAVKRYPISIEWPPPPEVLRGDVAQCRAAVRQRNGLSPQHLLGVGVDRLDYTKGILERFRAVEGLLEMHPEWIGRFSFIQIAAPSRSNIPQYRAFESEVRAQAVRINERFAAGGSPPIILKVEHHDADQVYEHYRAAEFCYVSSLHDGMNLVAKEFVASRDDDQGVLVLSQFTGAARELLYALVVNPYDIEQCAKALHSALKMPAEEQRERMRRMRGLIREFNVYRWAGRMLLDAAGLRADRQLLGEPRRVVRLLRLGNRQAAVS
jgi:trehalose 6-phosphate synthase